MMIYPLVLLAAVLLILCAVEFLSRPEPPRYCPGCGLRLLRRERRIGRCAGCERDAARDLLDRETA